jgi:Peptidase C13 family
MRDAFRGPLNVFATCLGLMTLRRRPASLQTPRSSTIIILFIIYFAALLGVDAIAAQKVIGFNEFGVSSLAARLGVLGLGALLVVWPNSTAAIGKAIGLGMALMGAYAVLVLLLWLLFSVSPQLMASLPPWFGMGLWLAIVAWVLFGAFRAGPLVWGNSTSFRGFRFVLCLVAPFLFVPDQPIVYGHGTSWSRTDVWNLAQFYLRSATAGQSEDDHVNSMDWESVIYSQGKLLDDQLRNVQASDPATRHVYFIGMAPSTAQTVFVKEVNAVRAIVDQHFNSIGRSVILQNSDETANSIALASNSGLLHVASGLKAKGDPEKDVLVLYITSHGSSDHISVSQYPLRLNPITPATIKQALDASGFRNRVVILSACHSGSFIDDLRDDHTAIITAARADRTSFGCSNDRDWTFFGDALFNHGFRQTRSLRGAFEIATRLVSDWEKRDNVTPSEPQLFIGPALEKVWDQMAPTFDQSKSVPVETAANTSLSKL